MRNSSKPIRNGPLLQTFDQKRFRSVAAIRSLYDKGILFKKCHFSYKSAHFCSKKKKLLHEPIDQGKSLYDKGIPIENLKKPIQNRLKSLKKFLKLLKNISLVPNFWSQRKEKTSSPPYAQHLCKAHWCIMLHFCTICKGKMVHLYWICVESLTKQVKKCFSC